VQVGILHLAQDLEHLLGAHCIGHARLLEVGGRVPALVDPAAARSRLGA
jgi:hypothetical protein